MEHARRALSLLDSLDIGFKAAVASVASACMRGGKLDSKRLDDQQWASYELALAAADLLAARTMLEDDVTRTELDAALAAAFATGAIVAVLDRLQGVHAAIGLDSHVLDRLASSEALRALRTDAAGPAALARLGTAVADNDGDIANVALDPHVSLARDAFRRFALEVVAPLAQSIHREDRTVPETLLQPLREMGVFGLAIPERYGGHASDRGDTPMMIAVTEALSEASLGAAGSLITRPEILARALLAGGTEAQKQQWLPKLAAGDPLCAISITEPDCGSDVASLSLRGTRIDGGWRLDGAKTWCTFAGKAGVLMVVARTDPDRRAGHRGLSLMLVEKPAYDGHEFTYVQDSGGSLVGRAIPTIGYRGMHSFDLAFENVFVPDANVIGEEGGLGRGFYLTMAGMVGGRIQTAGRALGVMRAALEAAVRYAKDRNTFGAPLADYQLTRVKLARMAARYAACRHLAYAVARRLDAGGNPMEASLVKLLACRTAEWVTREAMQIHGGMGYAEETAVSRYFVDARVLSIFEGAEETLALKVIAKSLYEASIA